jgi:carbamoyl-phosphate synthase large subunit
VLAVLERERPAGVCIQFGGQTPLRLARAIERAGFRILGTPFDAIDLGEDRERFARLAAEAGVRCPEWGIAAGPDEAVALAARIGYPVLVRPSYVLGGRAMRVCYSEDEVRSAMGDAAVRQHQSSSSTASSRTRPSSTWTRCPTGRTRTSPR